MKENKNRRTTKSERESTIDDRLDQIIEMKKNENSALRKIFDSLKNSNDKKKINKD